jgi:hypothetical protein
MGWVYLASFVFIGVHSRLKNQNEVALARGQFAIYDRHAFLSPRDRGYVIMD